MMPQSARILTTTCPKPAVPLENSKRVWQSHSLRLSTKIQVNRAIAVHTHLFGAKTWVLYWKQIRLLEWFHQHCLHSILGIKWQHHLSNEEFLKRASLPNMESILPQVQLCWAGHVTRMEDVRMAKAVFFSKLQEGKHDCAAPKKRHKDHLKRQLAQAGISHQSWQQEASDRDSWRSSVRKASCEFEAERHKATKENGRRQKEPAASLPSSSQTKHSGQSVVGNVHQESVSTATNECARTDHQPSQQS